MEPKNLTFVLTVPDQPGMVVDPAPKVVLQNRLARCRAKLEELKPVIDSKRKRLQKHRLRKRRDVLACPPREERQPIGEDTNAAKRRRCGRRCFCTTSSVLFDVRCRGSFLLAEIHRFSA